MSIKRYKKILIVVVKSLINAKSIKICKTLSAYDQDIAQFFF